MQATDQQRNVIQRPPAEDEASPTLELRSVAARVSAFSSQATRRRFLVYDASRRRSCIQNDSATAYLYVGLGNECGNNLAIPALGAGQRLYSFRLAPGQFWESPIDFCDEIWGIWDVVTAGDAAMVTEYR
jgi:hypothetical protein